MNTYNITLKLLVPTDRSFYEVPIKKEGTIQLIWSSLPKWFRKVFPKFKDAYIVELTINHECETKFSSRLYKFSKTRFS